LQGGAANGKRKMERGGREKKSRGEEKSRNRKTKNGRGETETKFFVVI